MIATKALRSRVVDLAIQGKLTEQLESDGTAEELYQQIQAEKQRLIKEGKIKKEKPLPEIKPEEVPFEIPRNWKLVRLSSISKKITDGTHHSPVNTESGDFMYVTAKNIKENGVDLSNITYVSKDVHEEIIARCNPELNDIFLIKDGATTGVVTVNNISEPFSLLSSVALIKPVVGMIDPWYIVYVLRSSLFYKSIRAQMTGTGITRIVLRQIEPFLVPLPPLAEQKRIVARVEEIFRLLDTIDEAQKQYAMDVESLKAKLVTAGIQGKLTKQLDSDGTAEELYQQIQAEKQRLIKEGKLKKEKPLPEISEDEIPFEIPENWKWVRWGNLSESIQYGYNAPAKESGRIKLVRITDIQNNSVQWQNVPFCDIEETAINDYLLQNGDILFARTGGTVGKSFIVTNISEESVYAGYLIRTRYSSNLSGAYLKLFMESKLYWKQLQVGTTATAQPNCNGKTLSKMILPLPPLAEQKRIADKLDEVLEALDGKVNT